MKAKKVFLAFFLANLAAVSYSQESTTSAIIKDTWNGFIDAYMSGEALEAQQKFRDGLLKQGVNTTVGIAESLFELPGNLVKAVSEYEDVVGNPVETMYYFGKYSLESVGESMANIYYNYTSGDPERIGAATFDIGLTVATVKGSLKSGKNLNIRTKENVKNLANKNGFK